MRDEKNVPEKRDGLPLNHAWGELTMRVFGEPANVAGEWLALKLRNLARLDKKIPEALEQRGVAPESIKALPPGTSIRVIEHVAKEDDDEVLDMWAKLIASGVDPDGDPIDKTFISVLSEISACEVQVLKFLWLRVMTGDLEAGMVQNAEVGAFADQHLRKYPVKQRAVAIQNLRRQQCVKIALSQYYLEQIGINSTGFVIMSQDERSRGRAGGDSLSELKGALDAARRMIQDLSGEHDWHHLGLNAENDEVTPEISFALTELGVELMRRCEPFEKQEEVDGS